MLGLRGRSIASACRHYGRTYCREWWQKDRRDAWVPGFSEHQTASVASLDVRAALDVAKSRIRTIHGDPWTRGGSTSGGDAGREEICLLREPRDGVSLLTLHTTRQHGGTSSLEEGGQNTYCGKPKESGRPWERGSCLEEEEMTDIDSVV